MLLPIAEDPTRVPPPPADPFWDKVRQRFFGEAGTGLLTRYSSPDKELTMVSIMSLWLPILLSAVIVFVVSSIIHMFLPYHRSDYVKVPDEDRVRASLGAFDIPPDEYVIPHAATPKEMGSPEYIEKATQGPNIMMTVMAPGPPTMTSSLVIWFVYSIVIGIVAAYFTGRALGPGADYMAVFRFSGATAFIAYSLALPQNSIWYQRKWSSTLKSMFDGLIYGLLTGGTFGWLWPA